jgi:adenine/guanine phosphoribosyltransferase-like PRPP-binding protein
MNALTMFATAEAGAAGAGIILGCMLADRRHKPVAPVIRASNYVLAAIGALILASALTVVLG